MTSSLSDKWVYRLLQSKIASHDVCTAIYQLATPWIDQFRRSIQEHKWKRQFGECLKEMAETYQHLRIYNVEQPCLYIGVPLKRKLVNDDYHWIRNKKLKKASVWDQDHGPLSFPQRPLDYQSYDFNDEQWDELLVFERKVLERDEHTLEILP